MEKDQTQDSKPTQPVPLPIKSNWKKIIVGFGFALVIAAVGVSGYILGTQKNQTVTLSQNKSIPTPETNTKEQTVYKYELGIFTYEDIINSKAGQTASIYFVPNTPDAKKSKNYWFNKPLLYF